MRFGVSVPDRIHIEGIRPTAHAQIRGGLMAGRLRASLLVEEWLPTLCSRYDTNPNWVKSVRRPPNDLLSALGYHPVSAAGLSG